MRVIWKLIIGAWFVGTGLVGCISIIGGGECQNNGDCLRARGAGWVCAQLGADPARRCVSDGSVKACASDQECNAPEVCIARTCRRLNPCQCSVDADCKNGQSCTNCYCVTAPASNLCKADADCQPLGTNFRCNPVGNCVSGPATCTNDTDCAAGEVCGPGRTCLQKTPDCSTGPPCAAGYMCSRGVCIKAPPPPPPGQCIEDSDCPVERPFCNITIRTCVECLRDTDCSGEESCDVDGVCHPSKPCECKSSVDCQSGQVCTKCQCVQGSGPIAVGEGELCDINGQNPSGPVRKCASGFTCFDFSPLSRETRCARPCRTTNPEDCGHNEKLTCIQYTTEQGICAQVGCKSKADCVFTGFLCQRLFDRDVCLPETSLP